MDKPIGTLLYHLEVNTGDEPTDSNVAKPRSESTAGCVQRVLPVKFLPMFQTGHDAEPPPTPDDELQLGPLNCSLSRVPLVSS